MPPGGRVTGEAELAKSMWRNIVTEKELELMRREKQWDVR
jgi:hypothetical protein